MAYDVSAIVKPR